MPNRATSLLCVVAACLAACENTSSSGSDDLAPSAADLALSIDAAFVPPDLTPPPECTVAGDCQGSSMGCCGGVCTSLATAHNCNACGNQCDPVSGKGLCGDDGAGCVQCNVVADCPSASCGASGCVCSGHSCVAKGALGEPCGSGFACVDGTKCAGQLCRYELGKACTMADECASANCIDGVCCGSPSCPACKSCGATGACDVTVTSSSDDACNGASACNSTGQCNPVWTQVATLPGITAEYWTYGASLDGVLYFAGAGTMSCQTQYFASFNPATGAFTSLSTVGSPLYACGFGGALTGVNGKLCYFANTHSCWDPMSATWQEIATVPPAYLRGEAAYAALGTKLYQVGGRFPDNTDSPSADFYDTSTSMWTATTDAPINFSQACAGFVGTNLHVVGSAKIGPTAAFAHRVLDTLTGIWTTAPIGDDPYCIGRSMPTWHNKLVEIGGQSIWSYDETTGWRALGYPSSTGKGWVVGTADAGNDLYAVGGEGTDIVAYKYTLE